MLTRRDLLRSSALGFGAFGLQCFHPFLINRRLMAQDGGSPKKMIFIFQRGGNDGINTCIPRGDSDYNNTNRPTIFIPEADAIDSGNNFAQFHPMLAPVMEIYNHSTVNGQDGLGNLAVIHRVGYDGQSQSHFDSQDYWENGSPGDGKLREGFIYRRIAQAHDLADAENSFLAASLSSSQLMSLSGTVPFPSFRRLRQYSLPDTGPDQDKVIGSDPTEPGALDGKGIRGLYGGNPTLPDSRYADLVHKTGQALAGSLEQVNDALAEGDYVPENGAVYPDNGLGQKLQETALLLKRTPMRIVGVNIGGWDTHGSQGRIYGDHGNLLQELAGGFQALSRDLQNQWDDLIIVTMTEFGRTSLENSGGGTDHAESSVMFVAGGGVKGGVYNCDANTWKTGDMFSVRERYLSRRTDFRSVFAEIFTKHFGDDADALDEVMPGYNNALAANPGDFTSLGFL